ncbi:PAS domain S-box protein [Arenibacter sp. GZD96]|uniref:PAS domain-containing sensor histidine kinase n=1 Tax=Aurantibrevibacter litoralis TaxID=3106030 RepID=UPI002AFF669B|nr:PAS domain S-box protein [Arenibacter sp. GZD-96]MEA1784466.1 PAS domain S-box protein [Arenibacter sp. GZD-96]
MKELEDYKYALDQIAIVAVTDANGIITYANDNFCKISKYTKEELIGQDHCIINSGHHPKDYFKELWATIKAGKVWKGQLKNKAKDGSEYWVEMTIVPFLNEEGIPYQYLAIRTNISPLKEANEALLKSHKKVSDFKYALDAAAIVAITDAEGTLLFVNTNFCAVSKYQRDALVGQQLSLLNSGHHSKTFIKTLWETIGSGTIWRGEFKNKAQDGAYYWVQTTIVPFLDENGQPWQYMSIQQDITEKKNAEERLLANAEALAHKNKQLIDFCNIVSHNLRAPLINITMLVDFLEESTDPEEQQELLTKIKPVTTHLMDVFNELVESLQVQQDKDLALDKIDINSTLRKVLLGFETQINEYDAEVILEIEAAPTLYCPQKYMESICNNLLSNALKYRSPHRNPTIRIKTEKIEKGVRLAVHDNGLGIDLTLHQNNLFKIRKTFHAHPDAKGFGLFMTKAQVEAIDGKIWAESYPDKGSTFYVEFKNPLQ